MSFDDLYELIAGPPKWVPNHHPFPLVPSLILGCSNSQRAWFTPCQVRNNTQNPLHFWFIDNFLSPKFKVWPHGWSTGHCGFQSFYLGPFWLIAGLEMTGDDWSILDSSMWIGVGGWRHSFHGWQRGIGPRHQLHTDRKADQHETNTWACDMNWYVQSSSLGGLHSILIIMVIFGWNTNLKGTMWFHLLHEINSVLSWADAGGYCSCTAQVRLQVRLRDLQVAILAESAKHGSLSTVPPVIFKGSYGVMKWTLRARVCYLW